MTFLPTYLMNISAREQLIAQLLWHVEQVMGEISQTDCIVQDDNDLAILRHNFRALIVEYEDVVQCNAYF